MYQYQHHPNKHNNPSKYPPLQLAIITFSEFKYQYQDQNNYVQQLCQNVNDVCQYFLIWSVHHKYQQQQYTSCDHYWQYIQWRFWKQSYTSCKQKFSTIPKYNKTNSKSIVPYQSPEKTLQILYILTSLNIGHMFFEFEENEYWKIDIKYKEQNPYYQIKNENGVFNGHILQLCEKKKGYIEVGNEEIVINIMPSIPQVNFQKCTLDFIPSF